MKRRPIGGRGGVRILITAPAVGSSRTLPIQVEPTPGWGWFVPGHRQSLCQVIFYERGSRPGWSKVERFWPSFKAIHSGDGSDCNWPSGSSCARFVGGRGRGMPVFPAGKNIAIGGVYARASMRAMPGAMVNVYREITPCFSFAFPKLVSLSRTGAMRTRTVVPVFPE